MGKVPKFEYRDVCGILQKFREFLLGRRYTLHGRFAPALAPRSIPPADIPKGPPSINSYSNQYYFNRSSFDSVKAPVVAPVAEGPRLGGDPTKMEVGGISPDCVYFPNGPPTPGTPWWWDGHCYFENANLQNTNQNK